MVEAVAVTPIERRIGTTPTCVDVVVAAHEPVVLFGLMAMLRTTKQNFDVVASCRDGRTCLQAIRKLSPALAVLDSSLPDRGVLHVLAAVRSEELRTRVIVLSGSDDPSHTANLVGKGAYRILPKEVSPDALVRCLRQIPYGRRSPPVLKSLDGHDRSAGGLAGDLSDLLTERERQIMHLVCEGLSNKDIGRQLKLSDGTVKVHLHHIYEKLAIHNRTALAMLAAGKPRPGLEGFTFQNVRRRGRDDDL
jgi:two-component system, NarL family, nitrate/nitrite response regulator NarL